MKLFEPIKVGRMELKNRIAMPAIHHCYTPDGFVNERLIEYYAVRARGGAGLITVGGCTIDLVGQGPMMIGLHDDKFIDGLKKLAEAIKLNGAAAAAQLYQSGRYSHSILSGMQAIAPSAIASRLTRETPREMTLEDIETVIDSFGEAARRTKEAGFDAVEVIASAGYLRENRCRFGVEVIQRIRQKVGNDYTVMVRISGNDFMPGSSTNQEAALFAAELEKAGVDCFNVTGGWHESRVPQITGELPRGGFAYLARGIKEAVTVPVIASNRINDPLVAEEILQQHLADMVNMGRPLIADPDLPNKALDGDYGAIRRCIACNQGCLDMVFSLQDVHCTVNPAAGRELETEYEPAENTLKVLIIGGGPAGMETAVTAAARGHQVSLWEKGETLGGNLRYAAMPPGKHDFITLLDYYEDQLARNGVEVYLNREASADEIIAADADVVVVATGARAVDAPFPVADDANTVSALEVLDGSVVPGEHDAETPERLKEMLNRGTRKVTLVELEKGVGRDIGISTRWVVLKCIHRLGVEVMDQAMVKKVTAEGVYVEKDGEETLLPADTVVLAIGATANNTLATELEGKVKKLHLIGDAKKPRKITEAVREGFDLAREL